MSSYNPLHFLKSAFSIDNALMSLDEILTWLTLQNQKVSVCISKTHFHDLDKWILTNQQLSHVSGKFFSIEGIRVKTNWGLVKEWDQPIINQPEVGFLGFIAKEFSGTLHFLMQAKIEPGNVNYVQLSPTLQATRSNYTQVHKGSKPHYLEYFQNAKPDQILLDQLQSEQGARFLKKRNRNIIIKIEEEISLYDNFIWVTLGQLKKLMRYNNLINMDSRTVISGIPFGNFDYNIVDFLSLIISQYFKYSFNQEFLKSTLLSKGAFNTKENIITFLTRLKSNYDLEVSRIPIKEVRNWVINDKEIYHENNKFFKVIAVNVEIGNREVIKWGQPMIEPAQEGICAFVCKEINGLLHFAVQAKLECGNHDIIEFAPTVQCLTGNYRESMGSDVPFLDYVLTVKPDQIVFDTYQSEEGGRFFKEQNRNLIVIAHEEIPVELPENYIWMTLNQINEFIKYNNYLNIQARSLISAISFV